ncbi:MAG: prolipoprotein diacylglyceryl transferase [Planctomycetia bacterium]|nr:prolipoprotein diacylglyceryl transferase [Planctomycetia bacterium]
MKQVLVWLGPLPIFGFGMMLFVAFLACTWLIGRRAEKEGIARQHLYDLAIWIFVGGIVGARIVYMIQYNVRLQDFWKIWEGGLVFYGSAGGGLVGYLAAYWFIIRKHGLSTWQIADILAPAIALGLCLGRIGCLLNGCCFGHVACADCPAVHFPLSAPPRYSLVNAGLQTTAGFTVENRETDPRSLVTAVEPGSAAEHAGLKVGDLVTSVDGFPNDLKLLEVYGSDDQLARLQQALDRKPDHVLWFDDSTGTRSWQYGIADTDQFQAALRAARQAGLKINVYDFLWDYLTYRWPRGEGRLQLTVARPDGTTQALPVFEPKTLGLHPTQLYETISMALLFAVLLAWEPFRRRRGELIVVLMLCYAVHRFINESLRNDTSKYTPLGESLALTLSQWISILIFVAGLVLLILLLRRPVDFPSEPPVDQSAPVAPPPEVKLGEA